MQNETLLPKTSSSGIFYSLASLTLVTIGLIYFSGILKPFIIAFFVWFIINQLKQKIANIKIKGKSLPPAVSSLMALVVILIILYLIVELLVNNIEGIMTSMPEYIAKFNDSYADASAWINDPKATEYLQKGLNSLDLAGAARSAIDGLSGVLGNTAVVIVYVIFFIMEDSTQRSKLEKLYPEKGKKYRKFMKNMENIRDSISSYIWQKTVISLITGAVSYVILLVMGIEYAFLWAFLIFVLNYIPYIGPLFSSLFPAIFAVVSKGDIWQFVYVFAAMEGVQIILGNFIEPMIMGKGTNLGPVTVIVALAFWGMIWGIVGMIMAVPVAAITVIICSQMPSTKFIAVLLSEKGDITELDELD